MKQTEIPPTWTVIGDRCMVCNPESSDRSKRLRKLHRHRYVTEEEI